jgi:hypothetical protein
MPSSPCAATVQRRVTESTLVNARLVDADPASVALEIDATFRSAGLIVAPSPGKSAGSTSSRYSK